MLLQTRKNITDIGLAALVMCVVGVMILPIPPHGLDVLIAINLSISGFLMCMALYIPNALAFSVFPTLLLFTTLFRLSLNIATSRMILLHANAGDIIYTFGNLVVGGNFVVGAVIFLILTIVQFIVIAKGAERVAEVAARFSLDAMPGKQMSIDADMRAGAIDMEEARKRRTVVTTESLLYGAMDGAMKFVKGDAIAGMVVTVVNIVGGLAIGILQNDMPAGEALQTYSILTIGDGLVSQIPALLISITAGIVVTRVSGDEGGPLGGEMSSQFMAQPKAMMAGGGLAVVMALVPGFPKLAFLLFGFLLLFTGYVLQRKVTPAGGDSMDAQLAAALAPAGGAGGGGDASGKVENAADADAFSITVPLMLDLSESFRQELNPKELNNAVVQVRRALYHEMGVPFPGVHLRFNALLAPNAYTILLHEIPTSQGQVLPGKVLVRERAENLDMMGFSYEQGENFLHGLPCLWMPDSAAPLLQKANMSYLKSSQILAHHLGYVLKRHGGDFLGIQETRYLLSQMEGRFAELVREVQRVLPVQRIAEVLQRLVQEQVSVRNLRLIFEALVDWGQKEKDMVLLVEYVRGTLKRQISYQYGTSLNVLPAYLLDGTLEDEIRAAIRQTSSGSYLALDPATASRFVQRLKEEVGVFPDVPPFPVLLTSMDIRRFVRKLIEAEYEGLPVVSYQELTGEVTVQPLGRVTL